MSVQGKTALVIGGTHGMGRAAVEMLGAGGAKVIATGSSPTNLERLRQELPDVSALQVDLSKDEQVAALADQLPKALDAVFVFAGTAELGPIEEVTPALYDRQFAINTRGVFFAVQGLLGRMNEGGAIILTTVTPSTATPTMGVYEASKAAIGAFGKVLAAELLPRKIRVNMVAPGFIDTPTLGVPGLTAEQRREFHAIGDAVTPMGRHGSVEEIAKAALFLAFDATFSTGVELAVDGGLSEVDAPAG